MAASDASLQKYKRIFDELDINKDGKLSFDELQFAADGVKRAVTETTDELSFDEFVQVMAGLEMNHPVTKKEITMRHDIRPAVWRQYSVIFKLLDVQAIGQVDADTIANKLRLPPSKALQMVQDADQDGDGMMDFPEFVHFMASRDPNSHNNTKVPENLTDVEEQRYRMLFDLIDADNQSSISMAVLKTTLHLDEQLFETLVSCCEVSADGAVRFPEFCEAMHEYEVVRDRAFKTRSSLIEVVQQSTDSALSDEHKDKATEAFSLISQDDVVSSLSILNMLETTMHSGKYAVATADYQLHSCLQQSYQSVGPENLNLTQFLALLGLHPGNIFLVHSLKEPAFATPTAKIGSFRRTPTSSKMREEITDSDELLERVFAFFSPDGKSKVDKTKLNSGFMEIASKHEDQNLVFQSLFVLLEAFDTYGGAVDIQEFKAILSNYSIPMDLFSTVTAD